MKNIKNVSFIQRNKIKSSENGFVYKIIFHKTRMIGNNAKLVCH